jgi:hypothetical protein
MPITSDQIIIIFNTATTFIQDYMPIVLAICGIYLAIFVATKLIEMIIIRIWPKSTFAELKDDDDDDDDDDDY